METPGQEGIRLEYQQETGDDFYPFARRQDRDDVAGFKIVDGEIQQTVISVHLTWVGKKERPGFPLRCEYTDLFQWLQEEVIPETIAWASEDELEGFESS